MYQEKSRRGRANLIKRSNNKYVVGIPTYISEAVFGTARKRINLDIFADSVESTSKALLHLDRIQKLIDNQDWEGLIQYENTLKPKVVKGVFQAQTLQESWIDYVNAKKSNWEISYLENDIKQTSRILNLCPPIALDGDYNELINYLFEVTTTKQVKRHLKQVSACLTWCVRRKLIKDNPLPEFIKTLETKKKNDEELDINPFSREERDLIIDAFKTGKFERYKDSHTQYSDYIQFAFFTGARTSEILGLRWSNIDFDQKIILFKEAKVLATNGNLKQSVQKKGLKTQKQRYFPMNNRLAALLKERKEKLNPIDSDTCIFEGLNHHVFRGGAYTYILKKLGIEYRKPYQTRHTFITIMANESDLKLHQIAHLCGTSTSVIENHYLANKGHFSSIPEI